MTIAYRKIKGEAFLYFSSRKAQSNDIRIRIDNNNNRGEERY